MMYDNHMTKIRTTLVLEEEVFRKLKQSSSGNMSKLANQILKKKLLEKKGSIFGILKGKISVKDIEERDMHEDLYR